MAEEARRFLSYDTDISSPMQLFSRKSNIVQDGRDGEDAAELSDGEAIIQGHESTANGVAEEDGFSHCEEFEIEQTSPVKETERGGFGEVQDIPSSTREVCMPPWAEPSMNQAYKAPQVAELPATVASSRMRRQPTDAYDPFRTPASQIPDSGLSEQPVSQPAELSAVSDPQELGPGIASPRDPVGNLLHEVDGTSAPSRPPPPPPNQAHRAANEPRWSADDFPSLQTSTVHAQGGQRLAATPRINRRLVKSTGNGTISMPGTFSTPNSSNSSLQDTAARQA